MLAPALLAPTGDAIEADKRAALMQVGRQQQTSCYNIWLPLQLFASPHSPQLATQAGLSNSCPSLPCLLQQHLYEELGQRADTQIRAHFKPGAASNTAVQILCDEQYCRRICTCHASGRYPHCHLMQAPLPSPFKCTCRGTGAVPPPLPAGSAGQRQPGAAGRACLPAAAGATGSSGRRHQCSPAAGAPWAAGGRTAGAVAGAAAAVAQQRRCRGGQPGAAGGGTAEHMGSCLLCQPQQQRRKCRSCAGGRGCPCAEHRAQPAAAARSAAAPPAATAAGAGRCGSCSRSAVGTAAAAGGGSSHAGFNRRCAGAAAGAAAAASRRWAACGSRQQRSSPTATVCLEPAPEADRQ